MDRPDFSIPVARNGYAWWYLDALSDDGRHGLTVIAFIGSVFSPYYAWARRRARALAGGPAGDIAAGQPGGREASARPQAGADPEQHVAINVALYQPGGKRWAMTERGAAALERTRDAFRVGDSVWQWQQDGLTLDLREVGVPWPQPIVGRVRLKPLWREAGSFDLESAGRHRWQPFAPRARVGVELDQPALRWSGDGYLDGNVGDEALTAAFQGWHWSRLAGATHTGIVYDLVPRRGEPRSMSLQASERHGLETVSTGPRSDLPPTLWGVHRRAPAGATLLRTLEDTPFYARSEIGGRIAGEPALGVHESLDAARLRSLWVNLLLPFRMPRRQGRRR